MSSPAIARPINSELPTWQTTWRQRLFRIRNKVIVPYLIITLFVAAIGTYIVTRLVAGSLQERLSNQLLESSLVATESVIRRENEHLETLRLIAFTTGMEEAILEEDNEFIALVINSLADSAGIPDVAILDSSGNPVTVRGSFDSQTAFPYDQSVAIQSIINQDNDRLGDKFSEINYTSDPPLFLIAAPIVNAQDPDTLVGIAVVATPLSQFLGKVKQEALSDVVAYSLSGDLVASTFILSPEEIEPLDLDENSVREQLDRIRRDEETASIEIEFRERRYQGLYAPLIVRNETVGLMAVFLPSDFIILEGGTSARIFAVIFGLAALSIILIGFAIARNIENPIRRLVEVSQNVTEGDLTQRSKLGSHDEIGFLGFTFDIMTERLELRTEMLEITIDALKTEAARLNSILKASKTGMVMIDTDNDLSFINEAASEFLRSKVQNSRELVQYFNEEVNTLDVLEIDQYILAVTVAEVRSEGGSRVGTLVALHDITQQELAGRLKDRFIARVSHELRTPLTVIKGYSDLAATSIELGRPPKVDHIDNIVEQTEILDQMIVQLLGISQMSAGSFTIRRDRIDFRQIVIDGLQTRLEDMQKHNLTPRVKISKQDFILQGDRQRLLWAFDNLLDNAIKYTLSGGTITIKLAVRQDNAIWLAINDTGVGIRTIDQPYIFDAYYRREVQAPDGEILDPRGLGLGLYVVQNVIEAHGGQVHVDSAPGHGSNFVIRLPL